MLPAFLASFEPEEHKKQRVSANPETVKTIESSQVFSPSEKVHLILLLSGYQRITDIGTGRENLVQYESELRRLEVPFKYARTEKE